MLVSIFLFVKNEHDIVVYTLVMSLSTLINYLISYFWIKRDIKLVKIHLSDFKPLFLPLTAMLVFANANMLFTFWIVSSSLKQGLMSTLVTIPWLNEL